MKYDNEHCAMCKIERETGEIVPLRHHDLDVPHALPEPYPSLENDWTTDPPVTRTVTRKQHMEGTTVVDEIIAAEPWQPIKSTQKG